MQFSEFHGSQSLVHGQFYLRFKPELRFTTRREHVHVHPRLLSREEKEPILPISEYRRTHCGNLAKSAIASNGGLWRTTSSPTAAGNRLWQRTQLPMNAARPNRSVGRRFGAAVGSEFLGSACSQLSNESTTRLLTEGKQANEEPATPSLTVHRFGNSKVERAGRTMRVVKTPPSLSAGRLSSSLYAGHGGTRRVR